MDPINLNHTAINLISTPDFWIVLLLLCMVALAAVSWFLWRSWLTLRGLDPLVHGGCFYTDPKEDGCYSFSICAKHPFFSHSLKDMWGIVGTVDHFDHFVSLLPASMRGVLQALHHELLDVPRVFHTPSHPFAKGRTALFDRGLVRLERVKTMTTTQAGEGFERHITVTGKRVLSPEGFFVGIVILFHDVTREYQLREELLQQLEAMEQQKRERQYVIDAAPYLIWKRDANAKIVEINQWFIESFGADVVANLEKFELSKHTRALGLSALEKKQPVKGQHHIVMKGKRCLFDITEIWCQDGTTIGYAHDITSLEVSRAELARFIAAQAELLESSASAMAVFGPDTRLQLYNNSFVKLWGLPVAFLDQQPLYADILELLREQRMLPEQTHFPEFKDRHIGLFTNLTETHNEFLYLPDGTALRVIVIPHALGGLLFAYENMSDKLAMERSYNTVIAVQRATLDNIKEGLVVFGQNGRIKLSNVQFARLWHMSEEVLKNEPHISVLLDHTEHFYATSTGWQQYKDVILQMLTIRAKVDQTLELKDGQLLSWRSIPLPDGSTLMTYNDVTDSARLAQSLIERNEALQEADRVKNAFLASISYELRSPLTTIIGFSEILAANYRQNLTVAQQDYLDGIVDSSHILMELINDIIDLNSIQAGLLKLSLEQFDIYEVLESVFMFYFKQSRSTKITMILDCPKNMGQMVGDLHRIKQVVYKLLSNAIKYSSMDGTVTLGAKEIAPGDIMIWIEDNGIGIPPEEQEGIFTQFFKPSCKSSDGKASGIGLAMIKRFIELHEGRIELHSTLGQGTRVNCYLHRFQPDLTEHYLEHRHEIQVTPLYKEA